MKKQKSVALQSPSLITGICEASGVQFEDSDEQIKNEGAITVRTIERIAEESTAIAGLGHLAITRKKGYKDQEYTSSPL